MTARIEIVPYRDEWPSEFAGIAAELQNVVGPLALQIDHIGSTSVPGLPAKDVIDIQITVARLDRDDVAAAVEGSVFELEPGFWDDHVPPGVDPRPDDWIKLRMRVAASHRRTNIHVRAAGRANQRYALLFRDYLRAHPEAAEAYARIKRALARLHADDVVAYYDVKDPVCDLIIQAAETWALRTGWQPGIADA